MKNQELEEKLLEVFGYTPEELNCADAVTALFEVYNNDTSENPITLLELFVSSLEVEQLIALKKLVAV